MIKSIEELRSFAQDRKLELTRVATKCGLEEQHYIQGCIDTYEKLLEDTKPEEEKVVKVD